MLQLNNGLEYSTSHKPIWPLIFLIVGLFNAPIFAASSQHVMSLTGRVLDAKTDGPLDDVKIHIVSISYGIHYDLHLTTDETGDYSTVLPEGYYLMTVIADDPKTPGLDYIPARIQLELWGLDPSVKEIVEDFKLFPGASVILSGSPELVEIGRAPEGMAYSFSTSDPRFSDIEFTGSVKFYDIRIWSDLGLEFGHIVVPSDTPLAISATDGIMDDNDSCFYRFSQGSRTTVDISKATMNRNIALVRDRLTSTWLQVERLSQNGIDVKSEVDDLDTALGLLDSAKLALRDGVYYECFLDLRGAYLLEEDVHSRTVNTLADVIISPIPLTFLLVLSGFGLASVLIEKNVARMGAGFLTSLLFLGLYYYVSPGWRLADPLLLLASCILAASMAIGMALLFPSIGKDVITQTGVGLVSSLTSTFSLATRNLKRRRLRSSLMLISILILVFGFTVFTSFQIQTAVTARKVVPPMYPPAYPQQWPPEGLMIVSPLAGIAGESYPISASMVEALRANPLVSSVAPKMEEVLRAQLISENGANITIEGLMGVSSDEVKMNPLDKAVIKGFYAMEEKNASTRAILISAKAADRLHVVPGDRVKLITSSAYGRNLIENYTVAGLLDDQIFEGIVDLDGYPIRPYYVTQGGRMYISPDETAVLNWNELMRLHIGRLARINVQTENSDDITPLAFQLARKWHWIVYASANDNYRVFTYSPLFQLSGGTAMPMLLVLVGLNVLACTLNTVYERRKEIATLSLVGLNPSQISYMFLAEAGLIAFLGGSMGYLLGLGGPRLLLSLGGPGFLTEKISWMWSVAVILMAVAVAISTSAIPALKASTIATPRIPRKWKLEYLPSANDMWQLHIPQHVSQLEVERFFKFIESQLPRRMQDEMAKMDMVDEIGGDKETKKLLFTHSFSIEGSRAFKTENELVATRTKGSLIYDLDLAIRIASLYAYEPEKAVRTTASAIRQMMLRWAATPSSERWGQAEEMVKVEGLSVASRGKTILRGINVSVNKGEILGLVGEGRRAMLLVIAGLWRPIEGSVQFRGIDTYSRRDEVKKTIGMFLQGTEPNEELSARENLIFMANLDGVRDGEKAVDDLMARCDLTQYANVRISDMSLCDKRKLMIAQGLINKPLLLLLEDPFNGLKEPELHDIVRLLMKLNKEGITVICAGRSVDELGLCDRIVTV